MVREHYFKNTHQRPPGQPSKMVVWHCSKCDSSAVFSNGRSEHYVNHYMIHVRKLPCMDPIQSN